jgi:hypothetical protein
MLTRRGPTFEPNPAAPRRLTPEARRLEGARIHKVSVWPPKWMAGDGLPVRMASPGARAVEDASIPADAEQASVIVNLQAEPILVSPAAPRAVLLAASDGRARYGRAPRRLAEAALAMTLAMLLLTFALGAIASHQWPRTEVAGIDDPLRAPRTERVGPESPASPASSDPFWPEPPAGRSQPPADAPAVQPKRLTSDPLIDPAARTLLFRENERAR